jgi:hypothetical protein
MVIGPNSHCQTNFVDRFLERKPLDDEDLCEAPRCTLQIRVREASARETISEVICSAKGALRADTEPKNQHVSADG